VTQYVGVFSDISVQKKDEDRLQHLSSHDPLTDLANRTLLLDRLGESLRTAARGKRQVALLFIDLDGFKEINDAAGHATGDRLLQHTARRLVRAVRETDTVARLGGDEFVILLPDVQSVPEVIATADRILERVSRPVEIAGTTLPVSCSIGIGLGAIGTTPRALLERADEAMYLAKSAGGHRYALARPGCMVEQDSG
jgi:diguanylate cyclase (GGDEF)-like protein